MSRIIRRIRTEDWMGIERIQTASYPQEVLESVESLQSHWKTSPTTCLVAEAQGELVGYILAHPWPKRKTPPLNKVYDQLPRNSDSLLIHDLALIPQARGTGIGRALAESIFVAGMQLGLHQFSLISVQGSQGFWSRFGFEEFLGLPEDYVAAVREFYPSSGFSYMELNISDSSSDQQERSNTYPSGSSNQVKGRALD